MLATDTGSASVMRCRDIVFWGALISVGVAAAGARIAAGAAYRYAKNRARKRKH